MFYKKGKKVLKGVNLPAKFNFVNKPLYRIVDKWSRIQIADVA